MSKAVKTDEPKYTELNSRLSGHFSFLPYKVFSWLELPSLFNNNKRKFQFFLSSLSAEAVIFCEPEVLFTKQIKTSHLRKCKKQSWLINCLVEGPKNTFSWWRNSENNMIHVGIAFWVPIISISFHLFHYFIIFTGNFHKLWCGFTVRILSVWLFFWVVYHVV